MCSTWNFLRPDFRRKNGENSPRGAVTLQRSGFFSTRLISQPLISLRISLYFLFALLFLSYDFPLSFLSFQFVRYTRFFWRGGEGGRTHDEFSFDVEHRTHGDNAVKISFYSSRLLLVSFPKLGSSFEIELWNCRKLLILCRAICETPFYTRTSSIFENGFK